MLTQSDVNFIQLITKAGYSVVIIDERMYTTDEFVPATERDKFHSLSGLDITETMELMVSTTHDHMLESQLIKIVEHINDKAIKVKCDFSADHKFKWFKPLA